MLAPARARASARFLDWLERADSAGQVFLSVAAIHEIEKGIALLEHKGATAKAALQAVGCVWAMMTSEKAYRQATPKAA